MLSVQLKTMVSPRQKDVLIESGIILNMPVADLVRFALFGNTQQRDMVLSTIDDVNTESQVASSGLEAPHE